MNGAPHKNKQKDFQYSFHFISINIIFYSTFYSQTITTAFDSRTKSARELMRQVQAERIEKANPKMKLNCNIIGTVDPPSVEFEFIDGNKVRELNYFVVVC